MTASFMNNPLDLGIQNMYQRFEVIISAGFRNAFMKFKIRLRTVRVALYGLGHVVQGRFSGQRRG